MISVCMLMTESGRHCCASSQHITARQQRETLHNEDKTMQRDSDLPNVAKNLLQRRRLCNKCNHIWHGFYKFLEHQIALKTTYTWWSRAHPKPNGPVSDSLSILCHVRCVRLSSVASLFLPAYKSENNHCMRCFSYYGQTCAGRSVCSPTL